MKVSVRGVAIRINSEPRIPDSARLGLRGRGRVGLEDGQAREAGFDPELTLTTQMEIARLMNPTGVAWSLFEQP
jgi:hypothetical protein